MALRQEGYWEGHYEQELKNYLDDGDEGEIWFGKGLNRKIVEWLLKRVASLAGNHVKANIEAIDIGCGNSFLLCTLVEEFRKQLGHQEISLSAFGIDYSANSISLSSKIVQDRQFTEQIELRECDFLVQDRISSIFCEKKFDFIIDKGTYDAICLLNSEQEEKLKQTKEAYLKSVKMLRKIGTIFVLASCNHTEEELLGLFESSGDDRPRLIDRIETPSLQFGGKSGSQVTCLIFEFII